MRVSQLTGLAPVLSVLVVVSLLSACGGESDTVRKTIASSPIVSTSAPILDSTELPRTPDPTAVPPAPTEPPASATAAPDSDRSSASEPLVAPELGLQTAGSTINIAGNDIRLSGDIWVKDWTADPPCNNGRKCPVAPYWTLQNEDALIYIDGNGKIWDELVGCGDPAPFELIKIALK